MENEDFLNKFISYITVEKGLAKNTAISYKRDIKDYFTYLKKHFLSLLNITEEQITDYLWEKKLAKKSTSTIFRNQEAIKGFYKFLYIEEYIKSNPAEQLKSPKLEKYLPDTLTIEEVDKLLTTANIEKSKGIRNKAILETLYATGMRVSELTELKTSDTNLDVGFIKCLGKGSKERIIPLGSKAIEAIRKYLNIKKATNSDSLFVNPSGKKFSRISIWKIIKKSANIAGITSFGFDITIVGSG